MCWTVVLLALLWLALAGCLPSAAPSPGATATGGSGGGGLQDVVRRATADAAQRSGVPPAQVRTVRAVDQEWPDGGLGCPDPAALYTQAIVPGYAVELEAGGRRLAYHADRRGTLVLCEGGRPVAVR
jgi:hypothetical protein